MQVEDRREPTILHPTDAIISLSASYHLRVEACWPYRGIESSVDAPFPMGHEYSGIVEQIGSAVTTIKPGQFVVGFVSSTPVRQRL